VEGFAAAFPHDAERADGGRRGLLAATPAAVAALAPHRDGIVDRFAQLMVERRGAGSTPDVAPT
jgi:hypothetical protein